MTYQIKAYAKINLTLDVFSKRADGYHAMASVMQGISLCDTLEFERTAETGIHFTCDAPDAPDVPIDESNLVVKAAGMVLQRASAEGCIWVGGVRIHLKKEVPSQAGLGGGSNDAAAALIGMTQVLELSFSHKVLHEIASALGSDVPFFLMGGTAAARGRGEQLTALPDIPALWLVVVKPEQSVSTGWAYNALDALPNRPSHRATKRMEEAIHTGDTGRLLAFQCNDFELAVFEHYPDLAWLRDEIQMAGALNARLCGSGSALYGIAQDKKSAERTADLLRKKHKRVYTAHTLTRAEMTPWKTE